LLHPLSRTIFAATFIARSLSERAGVSGSELMLAKAVA
jgi:hypothetical protein